MERLALVYRLKPGKKEEYIKAHKEIWPEITEGMKKRIRIFRNGMPGCTNFLYRPMTRMNRRPLHHSPKCGALSQTGFDLATS
jgi:hypothetical protein